MEPQNLVISINIQALAEFPEEERLPQFFPEAETYMHKTDTSFYHHYNPQRRLPAEKKLMLAILSNALNDLDSSKYEEDRRAALDWMNAGEEAEEYVFSFSNICHTLGYDKKTFSKAVEDIYSRFEKVRVRVKNPTS